MANKNKPKPEMATITGPQESAAPTEAEAKEFDAQHGEEKDQIIVAETNDLPPELIAHDTVAIDAKTEIKVVTEEQFNKMVEEDAERSKPIKAKASLPEKPKGPFKCRIENWREAKIGNVRHIFGNIYGHPEFAKGEPVRSSPMVSIDLENNLCITEKEIITLGQKSK